MAVHHREHVLHLRANFAEPANAGALPRLLSLRPGVAFSFTAHSTPAASAARFLAPLA
jgi:hypothetical protein